MLVEKSIFNLSHFIIISISFFINKQLASLNEYLFLIFLLAYQTIQDFSKNVS